MKKLLLLFISFIIFALPSGVFAEDFALTKIGALNVNGKYFTHWWYEPTRLTLEGTGSRGANIDVYVGDSVKTIKASPEDGKWKYTHEGELEKKDYNVKVASGDKQISFILTIGAGSVPEDALSQQTTKGGLPEAGLLLPLIGLTGLGAMLVYYGFREKIV